MQKNIALRTVAILLIFGTASTPLYALSAAPSVPSIPPGNPRQQVNSITAFLDGSVVYGSDATRATALRTFVGGQLKTSAGNLLPFNTVGLPNANDAHIFPNDQLFLAGDVRANENIELTAVQVLMMREHNRIATQIAAQNPTMIDEEIYQRTRQAVTAEIQAVTYNEFLPALLGANALKSYKGYNSAINAGIANEFATAAYRIGHTLVNDDVEFLDNDGKPVHEEMDLSEAFFNPQPLEQIGADPILKYLSTDNAQEVDLKVVDPLRNFLFGAPGSGGFDLASLNIQRGRDHGLADYNTTRTYYGLPKVKDWSGITKNVDVQNKLKTLYGSLDNIDLWVGGLAEDHVPGSSVGPTFKAIIVNQFERTRDGDPYFYERVYRGSDLAALKRMRLSDIIRLNTTITNLQNNVFFYQPATDSILGHGAAATRPLDYAYHVAMAADSSYIRSYDGSGTNYRHTNWGQVGADLLRLAPAGYGDGLSSPAGSIRPSARLISNELCAQTTDLRTNRQISDWVYAWGQFIDHDLDLTDKGSVPMNISVPKGDPYFDPGNTGTQVIYFNRASFDTSTGL